MIPLMIPKISDKLPSIERNRNISSDVNIKLPEIKNQRSSKDSMGIHDLSNQYMEEKQAALRAKLEALYSVK
jgi:hypothetical protein